MRYTGDYHTHTYYSDGKSSVRQNVESAIAKGLSEIAVTDHGYNNPRCFTLTREKFIKQKKEIALMREKYDGVIRIYHGIEADIIGTDGTIDLVPSDFPDMDIILMGYHTYARAKSFYDFRKLFLNAYKRIIKMPSKEEIARNTRAFISSIEKYPIDIIAHINHLLKVDCYEVCKACADYGTLVELNAKHIDTLPHELFEKMLTTKVKFIINSDAHRFEKIGDFTVPEEYLGQHNVSPDRIVNLGENRPVFKKESGR